MIQAAPSYDSFGTKFTTTETVITFLLTSPIYLILSQIQWEMENGKIFATHYPCRYFYRWLTDRQYNCSDCTICLLSISWIRTLKSLLHDKRYTTNFHLIKRPEISFFLGIIVIHKKISYDSFFFSLQRVASECPL